MTPEQFCYWLQGFAETRHPRCTPDEKQWSIIRDHLNEVFNKVTPAADQWPEDILEDFRSDPREPTDINELDDLLC